MRKKPARLLHHYTPFVTGRYPTQDETVHAESHALELVLPDFTAASGGGCSIILVEDLVVHLDWMSAWGKNDKKAANIEYRRLAQQYEINPGPFSLALVPPGVYSPALNKGVTCFECGALAIVKNEHNFSVSDHPVVERDGSVERLPIDKLEEDGGPGQAILHTTTVPGDISHTLNTDPFSATRLLFNAPSSTHSPNSPSSESLDTGTVSVLHTL